MSDEAMVQAHERRSVLLLVEALNAKARAAELDEAQPDAATVARLHGERCAAWADAVAAEVTR